MESVTAQCHLRAVSLSSFGRLLKTSVSATDNCVYNEKIAQRDANTARALAVVRFGHRPPARYTPTDRTDYNTLRRS